MAFNARNTKSEGTFDNSNMVAMNEYVVKEAKLEDKDTLVGYVSMLVDLGKQIQEDGQMDSDIPANEEAEYIEKNPTNYFKDFKDPKTKKTKRVKCFPVKAQQCVAIAIDFPDILLDKGQFFGDKTGTKIPLRLWLGGQFFRKGEGVMTIGRPISLQNRKNDEGKWSFAKNHQLYKMADAAKLLDSDDCFVASQIDELLGKAFQFEVQIHFNEGNDGKKYYTEYIKFLGALGRKDTEPEIIVEPMMVQFTEDNDDVAIKDLRSHIINTMRLSVEYAGSKVAHQIEKLRNIKPLANVPTENDEKAVPAQQSKVTKGQGKAAPKKDAEVGKGLPSAFGATDDLDNDIPY
jgi:hypothetical protein